ncbi:MAG TPA: glutamyl-tRNA amidotransferase [Gammaproteobacteria bacterium]|nr:glutamyl-tRNA amidotransferase [Gammaproteobacteria bacterium]HAU06463.1 glutamyl-tRNA amidotransferase [Gammaproteobacteria bacterium]
MPATASPLKQTIQDAVKAAMKAKEKSKLATLRQITAAIKQVEVDKRQDLSDDDIISILTKMCKQRRDALSQFEQAKRQDLADIEIAELAIIETFLPQALSADEIQAEIVAALAQISDKGPKAMGEMMKILRPKMQGRADMSAVSQQVKAALNS